MPSSELSYKLGKAVARKIFDKRGNHSEAHLSEDELSTIIIASIELYAEQQVLGKREKKPS